MAAVPWSDQFKLTQPYYFFWSFFGRLIRHKHALWVLSTYTRTVLTNWCSQKPLRSYALLVMIKSKRRIHFFNWAETSCILVQKLVTDLFFLWFLTNRSYGVFRLTDPPGLQVITNCRQKPLFHQHPGEDDIYTVSPILGLRLFGCGFYYDRQLILGGSNCCAILGCLRPWPCGISGHGSRDCRHA